MSKIRISDLIRIGEWLPDQPDTNNPGSNNVKNVTIQGQDYKPFQAFGATTNAIPDRAFGAFSFLDNSNVVHNFAGTQNELFKLSGSSWVQVSKTSTAANTYNTAVDQQWRFTAYGERVVATNLADEVQSFLVGTSTSFSALSTTAIKSRNVTVLNNFLVTVDLNDDDGRTTNRVRWSALNDPTDFVASATTLSGEQDLQNDGGAIQAVIGAQNYGVIIQERAITRMEFVGAPLIFTFTTAEVNRGSKALNSIVSDGRFVYYYSEDGFFLFDGTQSIPIGDNKVDRFFTDRLDNTKLERIKAAVNPTEKYIVWAYPDDNNVAGNPTDMILYHWAEQRWSQVETTTTIIETMFSAGFTLEGLDAQSTDLDALAFSLDSRVWAGGKASLGAFSTDNKLGFFDGANLAATLETSEVALNPGGRANVVSVMPITDSTSVNAVIRHRTNQFGSITDSSSGVVNLNTNEIPFKGVDDRFHRVKLDITAGSTWELVQGIRFRSRPSGGR